MCTLFLQAPSFEGFDGGAGSRYQARREIRSFWYPTWLAQPAALVENSTLIDAPPHRLKLAQIADQARDFDLAVLHTSAPSFASDVETIKALKTVNPALKAGFVGAKVAVDPAGSLKASPAIDFVARNEFDFTIKEIADGRSWSEIAGLSYRNADGVIVHNEERAILENMDLLPFVTPVYKRDLDIKNYFIGYLKHPYISVYTGRGCKSRCTFCLWPQTVGGHRYRTRSVEHVIAEIAWAKKAFPEVKEFFFDDDTFTDNLPRAEAIAKELSKLDVTWSCNAKANVPYATLKVLRDNGLRLLLVGYDPATSRSCTTSKKACGSTSPASSPRIVTRSASPFTALSLWGCRARPRKPSRKPSTSPPRSIRIRSRFRSPRRILAPSCSIRRCRTAGSTMRMPSSSTKTACKSRRCTIRI